MLGELRREQETLPYATAVARFSSMQGGLAREGRYQELLPLAAPGPGEQYHFEVDLDLCSSCKSCVSACHQLNGTDPGESWRRVTQLESTKGPYVQALTSACHHCLDPACMKGCPVQAYEKDPFTGIVRHLDDQCIGCQYCMMTCPYDVPQYNARLGIVRKCDMCSQRLRHGEAPACAQACPTDAISIKSQSTATLKRQLSPEHGASGLPLDTVDPSMTGPTTRYKSQRPLPPLHEVKTDTQKIEPAHGPLVAMLVLSQWAVGLCLMLALLPLLEGAARPAGLMQLLATATALLTFASLGLGTLHLGRPLWAFRALLGLRTSWMSREVLAFGGFAAATLLFALIHWPELHPWAAEIGAYEDYVLGFLLLSGLGGVLCSVMIYAATRRRCWSFRRTLGRFGGTSLIMGGVSLLLALSAWLPLSPELLGLAAGTGALVALKLLSELLFLFPRAGQKDPVFVHSAALLRGPLRLWTSLRMGLGLLGGGSLLAIAYLGAQDQGIPSELLLFLSGTGLLFLLGGETIERSLFFRSVAYPRLPGAWR